MPYLYLSLTVVLVASSSVLGGIYNRKNPNGKGASSLYNLLLTIGALIVWCIISCFSFTFNISVIWYSLAFGLAYVLTNLSLLIALKNGPVSLTSLFLQLSLIGATIWGFIFWDEQVTTLMIIGLFLAVFSLFFCLYTKKQQNERKMNAKWLIACALTFIGNVACTVIQKAQVRTHGESCGNMLMLFAVLFSVIFCFVIFIFDDKSDSKTIIKTSGIIPLAAGALNAIQNLFVVLMVNALPSGLVYPVLSVGGLAVSIIASLILFKEKLKATQWIGIALGAVSILLLSL